IWWWNELQGRSRSAALPRRTARHPQGYRQPADAVSPAVGPAPALASEGQCGLLWLRRIDLRLPGVGRDTRLTAIRSGRRGAAAAQAGADQFRRGDGYGADQAVSVPRRVHLLP